MTESERLKREFYKDVKMSQAIGTMKVFNKFLSKEKFNTLVELGTGKGILTLFLSDIFDGKIYTFNINDILMINDLISNGVVVVRTNIFKNSSIRQIEEIIQSSGRVLLLCDNGNKIKEVRTFSKFLKKNDVIMAHDYFKDKDSRDDSIWQSCEITQVDVEDVLKKYNLHSFYQEDFAKIAWMSKIRR